ncbi:MAG: hypothetical protein NZ853_10965 [Leptospiraceae bacterium]|nr:hypothetical protein [Leptospiraceae bacterium]MDW7975519.1 hypothetical protein [Leptospiraceae bacterium]
MKFLESLELQNLSKQYYLDLTVKKQIFPSVILDDDWFLGNPSSRFFVVIERDHLEKEEFWEFLWNFYQPNYVKLSRWWHRHFPEKNPIGIIKSFHWGYHNRTLSDWKEWSDFHTNSEKLLELYELPISVVRLWDRLNEELQNDWLKILNIFRIKKNYIMKIIEYLYDLPFEKQKEITKTSLELAIKYQENPEKTFPQSEIYEMVVGARYPLFYKRKILTYKLKKTLEDRLQIQNLSIQLPEDFESHPIELRLSLKSFEDLKDFLQKIQKKENQDYLKELIEKVYEIS